MEHAESVARLQGQLAFSQEKAKNADEDAARLRAAVKTLQDDLYSQTALLTTKVIHRLLPADDLCCFCVASELQCIMRLCRHVVTYWGFWWAHRWKG